MGLFDRIVNLARGTAKVWTRQQRDAEAPEDAPEEEVASDPEGEPPADPPHPPDEPLLPRKKRL